MSKFASLLICFIVGYIALNMITLYGSTKIQKYEEYRIKYAKPISQWEKPHIYEGVVYEEMQPLPKIAPDNPQNPYTMAKMLLGKQLFNDPKLSKSGQIACASCHNRELGFGDGLKTSFGHDRQRGQRNAPNIMMSGFFSELFWDGRAKSLESQALMPISNPIEMAHEIPYMRDSIAKISMYYPLFIFAFGNTLQKDELLRLYSNTGIADKKDIYDRIFANLIKADLQEKPLDSILQSNKLSKQQIEIAKKIITPENIAKAIATYERSLVPKNTRFNRFLQGEYNALSNKEIYGLHIFRTKGGCMNCHYGVALSDGAFHNIGLSFYGRKLQDLGRYEITKDIKDLGAFKTPSLIAISKSAPYMHNGIFPTLKGVIHMYNAGFPTPKPNTTNKLNPITTPLIKPLNLSEEEMEALEAFLYAL